MMQKTWMASKSLDILCCLLKHSIEIVNLPLLPLPLPKCLLIKKWVWKYFNSLEVLAPAVPPVWAWDWDEMNTREHQPLIGHNGGQTPFITDQIFGTIFHPLGTWNMNIVNCAFWGVKLINILRFIVNDRFEIFYLENVEAHPGKIPPAGSDCINIVHLMVWLIECCVPSPPPAKSVQDHKVSPR